MENYRMDFLSRVGFIPSYGFQEFVDCSDTSRYDLQELWEIFLEQIFEDVEILTEEDCRKYGMNDEFAQYLIQILDDTDFAGHFTISELIKRLAAFPEEICGDEAFYQNGKYVSITTFQYFHGMTFEKITQTLCDQIWQSNNFLDQNRVWFHGTTWKYAQSIIQDGIRTTRGELPHDFGKERAFYMTNDLDFAIKNAFRHGKFCQALVVFIFDEDISKVIKQQGYEIMDLTGDNKKWEEVIIRSRSKSSMTGIPEHIDAVIGPYAIKTKLGWYKSKSIQIAFPQRARNNRIDGGLVSYINNYVNMQIFKFIPDNFHQTM